MKHLLTLSLLAILQMGWAQSEYCLDGTVWDDALGGCVPESDCLLASDLDGDGSVGSSDLLSFLSEFGAGFPDADSDGICDNNDDCVGTYDECGVCNGPGPQTLIIENITVLYDSIYADQIDAWFVFEVGADTTFSYICSPFSGDCGDPYSYQGYDYSTVLIGEQCWFAENLRNENYSNGDAIPTNLSESEWENTNSGASAVYGEGSFYCWHNSPDGDACDEAWSLNEYGRLYNWFAVDDARGLCPSGWHVPTDDEWTVLTNHLGGESIAGGPMKMDFGWNDCGNGTNLSGFSGLPGGTFHYQEMGSAGSAGFWWSSSPSGALDALDRYMVQSNDWVYTNSNPRKSAFSVRCIRDSE